MANLEGFDVNLADVPDNPFGPIPPGKYVAIITDSDMIANKSGVGQHLRLEFEVTEGPYRGRRLWTRLNLDHPNPQVVQFAKIELAVICRALGISMPRDSVELHNLPLVVHVTQRKRNDTDEIVNDINGYSKKEAPSSFRSIPNVSPWNRP